MQVLRTQPATPEARDASGQIVRRPVLADTHVHLFRAAPLEVHFSRAAANFQLAGNGLGLQSPQGVLLLTQRDGEHDPAAPTRTGPWAIEPTAEPLAWTASCGEHRLALVRGRQIVTAERLEVLALLSGDTFADGLPLPQTVERVLRSGAVAVIPWGFGKWMFSRGRAVAAAIEAFRDERRFFLGDGRGRAPATGGEWLFSLAKRAGVRTLAGSDPLPSWGPPTTGSFGSLLSGPFDPQRPASSLLSLLDASDASPALFGARATLLGVAANQARHRFGKAVIR